MQSLRIKFYDVGHGSCTHITTPNGKHYLVDVGTRPDESVCDRICSQLQLGGKIDYLIITHPHLDHIGGLPRLVELGMGPVTLRRPTDAFPLQIESSDSEADAEAKRCANKLNDDCTSPVKVDPCLPGNNGGVAIRVFAPQVAQGEKGDLNNYSCVVVLEYAGFKVVLTGDNPSSKLLEMLVGDDFFEAVSDATVLLAPHHGRDNEYCGEFVKAVNPLVTVISDKPIMHDTQSNSASLYEGRTRGVTWSGSFRKVFTTRKDGTITFTFYADGSWAINTSDEY